jgi:16S rRNA (uracil1498-N3)-methyltransferase
MLVRLASDNVSMRTLLVPALLEAGEVSIAGEEAQHGLRVLRLRVGDEVRLADGAGLCAVARVVTVGDRELTVAVPVVETMQPAPAAQLTVACAIPKGDRFADIVRSLTEIGVGTILPLGCERGERSPNLARWRRIAAEAVKQCRRSHFPVIGELVEIPTLAASGAHLIVLDRQGAPFAASAPRPTTLVIGPEGGFTAEELDLMHNHGAIPIRLSSPILRIETAAIAAAAVWAASWESST